MTPPFEPLGRLGLFLRLADDLAREEIEAGVDALIARLDAQDGDADFEPSEDIEPSGDEIGDVAWVERGEEGGNSMLLCGHEDAEPEDVALIHRFRNRIRRHSCRNEPASLIPFPLIAAGERRAQRMGFDA